MKKTPKKPRALRGFSFRYGLTPAGHYFNPYIVSVITTRQWSFDSP